MTLLGAYPFDEPSGAYTDVSGNGNHFTDLGAGGRVTGHTGTAAFTPNGLDFPTRAPIGQTAQRTVMAWVLSPDRPGAVWYVRWNVLAIDSGCWGLLFINGNIAVQARNASTFVRASATYPAGTDWHHFAATWDGTNVRLYIDGVLAATTPLTGPMRTDADSLDLLVTSQSTDAVDELRILDEALDAATIVALMGEPPSAEVPVPELTGVGTLTLAGVGALAAVDVPVPELAGAGTLTLAGAGTLAEVPVLIPELAGSGTLTLAGVGTLAGVPAGVPQLAGTSVLHLTASGALVDPSSALPDGIEVVVFPDAEALLVAYLEPELAARALPARVSTKHPTDIKHPSPTSGRYVRVSRVGGPRENLVTDGAQMLLECWSDTESDAAELCKLARALVWAMDGQQIAGVWVRRVQEFSGPVNLPDPDTTMPRYQVSMNLSLKGAAL